MPVTFREAAIRVLRESGRPLTVEEITDRALESGLIEPSGKTPAATMSAVLYRDAREADSPFVKLSMPAQTRALRGSVRWTLRKPADGLET